MRAPPARADVCSAPRAAYAIRDALARRGGEITRAIRCFCVVQLTLNARLSIGSLKYMHHLGLDCFSTPEAHWTLQAVLTHSINDDLYALSLTCVLDAPALAATGLRGTDFVRDKMCPVGATFF